MRKRFKVLISAYACEPHKGSEPYVGWTWSLAISRVADEVHVITRDNNREPIEKALRNKPVRNLFFHYFDLPMWSRFWKKRLFAGTQVYYLLWQRAVGEFALKLHEKHQFDVVHHITFAGMIYPPGVVEVPVAFIWGPVGFVRVPHSLKETLHPRAKISELAHEVLTFWASRSNSIKTSFQSARFILKFPNTSLIGRPSGKVIETGNIFIEPPDFSGGEQAKNRDKAHIVSLTRLIFWKGVDLGIEAIALLNRKGMEFKWTIIGEGPEAGRLQRLVSQLGLEDCVCFEGWLPREKALEALKKADFMLHPAFREGWSGAVLEGMAAGLPVVCLDWGEPGFMVGEESGIKVSVGGTRKDIIEGLAQAIEELSDHTLRRRMGVAARNRVIQDFSLKSLEGVVERIYSEVVL